MDFDDLTNLLNEAQETGKDPLALADAKVAEYSDLLTKYRRVQVILRSADRKKRPEGSQQTREKNQKPDPTCNRAKIFNYLVKYQQMQLKDAPTILGCSYTTAVSALRHRWFQSLTRGVYELSQLGKEWLEKSQKENSPN